MKKFASGHRALVLLAVLVLIAAAAGLAMTIRPFAIVPRPSAVRGLARETVPFGEGQASAAEVNEEVLRASEAGARGLVAEREPPDRVPVPNGTPSPESSRTGSRASTRAVNAPARAPILNFDGLDFATWCTSSGHSPLGSVGKSG